MIKLYNKDTNELLGRITASDLEFLKTQLEAEALEDPDYYLTKDTIEGFASSGAPPHLVELLQSAIRGNEAVEIRWEKSGSEA